MLQSILIALDGSPFSDAATELGIRWAKRFDARLHALGIVDEPEIRGGEATGIGGSAYSKQIDEAQMADAQAKVATFLDRFEAKCRSASVRFARTAVVGAPRVEILAAAPRHDIVVLGRRTYFHFETQQKPDDTLEEILHRPPRPVVAAPNPVAKEGPVLVAYDGSPEAARALQTAQCLGLLAGQEVHVVSIRADRIRAREQADCAVAYLSAHDVDATAHAVGSGDAAGPLLLEQAAGVGAGLIVMGAYGPRSLGERLFGSVTQSVLDDATIPLFLYH